MLVIEYWPAFCTVAGFVTIVTASADGLKLSDGLIVEPVYTPPLAVIVPTYGFGVTLNVLFTGSLYK